MAHMNNSELKKKVVDMGEEAEDLKRQIMLNNEEVDEVQGEFDEIQQVVMMLVEKFQEAKFATKVGNKMQYNDQTTFNENNITLYLAELEEYFATLIAYLANQRGDQNAAISYIPLDQLNEKVFDKKEMQI
jgi:4-hydroxy-3-methylbut-2-enyl diphosphate reductase IspH